MTTNSAQNRSATAAVALGAATILVFGPYLVLAATMPTSVPSLDYTPLSAYAPTIPFIALAVIACLLVYRRPDNRVVWCLAAIMLMLPASNLGTYYVFHYLYRPDLPRGLVAPLGLAGLLVGGWSGLPLALLTVWFPDGKPPSRRWNWLVWAMVLYAVLSTVSAFDPAALGDGHRQVPNPIGVHGFPGVLSAANQVSSLAWFILAPLGLVSMVLRYRRSGAEVRHQIKWFGASLAILIACIVGGSITSSSAQWTTPAPVAFEIIGFTSLPVAIAVALLKYRLYDIDIVISRALVYGALAAFITAVYVVIVVGVGSLIGQGSRPNLALSILATAVVAVAFQTLRERLQKVANRLVYGKRATPYEVLSQFSGRVAETYAADDVLPRMARVLAEGTGAVSATVWLRAGQQLRPAATFPESTNSHDPVVVQGQMMPSIPGSGAAVPVRLQGELLGALALSKRGGETLSPIEQKLLDDLANQAGLVLKNVGLTADLQARLDELQASRHRLLRAQDGERRRLERVLRDGAERDLVAIKDELGRARALALSSPDDAIELLARLKAETDETLDGMREVARGIYPPLLAEKGLLAAVESQARKLAMPVTVEADGVARYSQEVEAAVYFCVLEALQNVQRHANASQAAVRLHEDGRVLEFEVTDDGVGFDPSLPQGGTGLANMADRLDALGGAITLGVAEPHGAVVGGHLPIAVGAALG